MSDWTEPKRIREILNRYGETRTLSMKGVDPELIVSAAIDLATRLDEIPEYRDTTDPDHVALTDTLRGWLAEPATEDVGRQGPPRVELDLDRPSSLVVGGLLDRAGGSADAVALHLVGATLQVRFAESGITVENHRYTTADEMLDRPGDFLINDTVFHVTLSPMQAVIQKCASNVTAGYKPYLLVPEQHVATARGMATIAGILDQVAIIAIEQFVGQNIDEMGAFSRGHLGRMFRLLLETYNTRVQAVETDPSLLIEIPENLS